MTGDDDDDVWQSLIATVKPLKPRNAIKTRAPVHVARFTRHIVQRDSEALRLPTRPAAPSPLPPRQAKKLQQQKIPVEARLDLHGVTVDNAQIAVRRFIADAWRNHLRCVELVTGRGDPHRGTGQLKRLVPFWLDDAHLRAIILHVVANPVSRGGSLLVLLRRNRDD